MPHYKKTISFYLIGILTGFFCFQPLTQASKSSSYYDKIKLGTEWFINYQDENFLHYEYSPFDDSYPDTNGLLRQMASMWAISHAGNFFKESRYSDLAKRGLAYFEKYLTEDQTDHFYYISFNNQPSTIAYSAFMILTLLEIDHPKKEEYLKKLAAGILSRQQADGSFKNIFYSDSVEGTDYYPGEALLALISLYEYTKDEQYLSAVEKAFPFYRDYWQKNQNTAFVPWHTQAYYKLYQATNDPAVKNFIFAMNDYIIKSQSVAGNCRKLKFTRGIVIAVFIEGVTRAYSLAKSVKDNKRTFCYRNFIKRGAAYVTELQIRPDNNFGLKEIPKAALGGFLGGKKSTTLRVDNNQHAIMGLMESYRLHLIK